MQTAIALLYFAFGVVRLLHLPSAEGLTSDFQLGFRGTQGFRKHLLRVSRLVSKKVT